MADSKSSDRILLKILSGIQAGAEVSLVPGEYAFGSGPEDDIQFIDVSLRPAHARLRVAPGKIEIRGGAGSIATSNGLRIAAGGDTWQELEPLEIVTAGTMRFALGPSTAQWSTLADAPPQDSLAATAAAATRARTAQPAGSRFGQIFLPILLMLLAGGTIWYLTRGPDTGRVMAANEKRSDIEILREGLDQFPFGRAIDLRKEVDGTIFATGYVESGVERRALTAAVEKTGIPVRFRLGVLQALRGELDGMIRADRVPVTFTLAGNGDLALEGLILNDDLAQKFVERIKSSIIGINQIDSRIRTAKTLLGDIERLGKMSQIEGFVVFRLDGELIEANGILPTAKIDSWVGFLQSYSRRFAKDIGLRSFVRLQNPDGTTTEISRDQAITLGGKAGGNDIALDIEKLKQGQYDLGDIFIGNRAGKTAPAPQAGPRAANLPRAAEITRVGDAKPVGPADSVEGLTGRANALIASWLAARRDGTSGKAEFKALDDLINARAQLSSDKRDMSTLDRRDVSDKYLPLLNRGSSLAAQPCRTDSRLNSDNIHTAIFWLDLLSLSSTVSLASLGQDEQGFVLEAALNPSLTEACLKRTGATATGRVPSLYLSEIGKNPGFVNFLTQSLDAYPMQVTGANLVGARYVQLRDGQKLSEGGAPDGGSRVAVVGELGIAIQRPQGFSAVIYGQSINWLARN